jgi:hypothetical protein
MTTPVKDRKAVITGPPWVEILNRLRRIESRVVQLMMHEGMTSDGRNPLPDIHHTDLKDEDDGHQDQNR